MANDENVNKFVGIFMYVSTFLSILSVHVLLVVLPSLHFTTFITLDANVFLMYSMIMN